MENNRKYEEVKNTPLGFWKFDTGEFNIFKGKFVEHKQAGKLDTLIFEGEDGVRYGLPTHAQILQATQEKGVGFYHIEFLEEKKLEGGKTMKVYMIGYSAS